MSATVVSAPNTPKQSFLETFGREHATTMQVLRAYPIDQLELRPAPKCKTARELAWVFVAEQGMAMTALTTGFDWSNPPRMPPAPESWGAILAALEEAHQRVAALLRDMPDEELAVTIQFPVGPQRLGDFTRLQFMWFALCDQIHHRGQFSIYTRMAGGRLPSIYGPTADEPWF